MGLDIDYRAAAGGAVSTVAIDKPFPVQLRSSSGTDLALPAAAALADNTPNPTAPAVGAFLHGLDGTWQRLQSLYANSDNRGAVNALAVNALAYGLNASGNWDRLRANQDITLLASAARTTTVSTADQTNYNGDAIDVVLDVTNAGTGSITVTIEGKDALSGKYYTLLAGAAVVANGTTVYRVGPGLTAAANAVANFRVPRTWRVTVTHNNANPITYSVGASLND
jgi:hypothetical protein